MSTEQSFIAELYEGYHVEFGRSTSKDMWQKQDSVEGLSIGFSEWLTLTVTNTSPHVRYFISFISSINTHKEAEKNLHTTIFMMSTGRSRSNVWEYVGSHK